MISSRMLLATLLGVFVMSLAEMLLAVYVGVERPAAPWQALTAVMLVDGWVKLVYIALFEDTRRHSG